MIEPDETLDLTGVPCPRNSARALLRLEIMSSGEVLRVIIDDGEPIANVPASLEVEGHTVERKHEPYTSAVMPPSYTPSRPSASARGRRKRASRAPDPA